MAMCMLVNYIHTYIYLTIHWGISVCVSVCLYVCLCVCASVRLYVSTVLNGSSKHLEGTFYGSWHVPWAIYCLCAHNARACACVLNARACVHSLIFERIISKCAGNILLLTIRVNDYVLFMFTHRAHACQRACARACLIKHSLIYGPTLFKCAVNILQITTSSMGYVLFMFTRRAHACVRARACARGQNIHSYLDGFSSNLLAHTTYDHTLHGLHTYHVHAPRAHARARVYERARD
jgi:hypothetical protein